jgi:hypothetical protein
MDGPPARTPTATDDTLANANPADAAGPARVLSHHILFGKFTAVDSVGKVIFAESLKNPLCLGNFRRIFGFSVSQHFLIRKP